METLFLEYTHCSLKTNNLDHTGPNPVLSIDDQIPKEAFGIQIVLKRSETLCQRVSAPFLMNTANAFDCVCGPEQAYLPQDSLVTIRVKTLSSFDASRDRHAIITDYFAVLSTTEYISVEDFIRNLNSELLFPDDLVFDLMLLRAPELAGTYTFEIDVELSDGRLLSTITNPVDLL